MIKTFILEEHNEAFLVWKYAVEQGLIKPEDNSLFHFDEHSDMSVPTFNSSINEVNGSMTSLERFTYEEVSIANFIVPTAYLKIVNRIYWFRQMHRTRKRKDVRMYVGSYDGNGMRLISSTQRYLPYVKNQINDLQYFSYHLRKWTDIPNQSKILLDIDLDFFSSEDDPSSDEYKIEITKDEYEKFLKDKYAKIRYLGLRKVEVTNEKGRYFYLFNRFDVRKASSAKVDMGDIKKRIENFADVLSAKSVRPQLITICRSRHSGYTPSDQWKYIEETLLDALSQIYILDIQTIDELLSRKAYGC